MMSATTSAHSGYLAWFKAANHHSPEDGVRLTSQWFIKAGMEHEVIAALPQYLAEVYATEPETLTYLVNTPWQNPDPQQALQCLPPVVPACLLFIEQYASPAAFLAHLHGAAFSGFVAQYGHLFITSNGNPYTTVMFLERRNGFIRGLDEPQS